MSDEHFFTAGRYIKHGDASNLFPVESLSGEVFQYRDAEVRLQSVESEKVVAVSPTGLASSYFLTQHPLTAIEVRSLSDSKYSSIAEETDIDLSRFEFIQIGRSSSNLQNRSLSEFE